MRTLEVAFAYCRLQLPLKWWFSALTACLGAFAGLLGSIYADQIKRAVPFTWDGDVIVWPAVFFWLSLLIFGLFFGLGFNAQNEATNKLEQVIRTLPPKGFLVVFEDLYKACIKVYWKAQADRTAEAYREAIVTALNGVLFLVKAFDTRHDHPTFSANIMLFRAIPTVDPRQLAKSVLFAEPGYDPRAWDGVLELQPEFASSLVGNQPEPDVVTEQIMLPVPKSEFRTDHGLPTVLPGAPAVYCDPTKFVGFENTLQLAAWCREHSGLRASIAEEVERYFVDGPGKEIRSFISFPILLPSIEPGTNPAVIGVVNLHSNREGILPGEKAGLFVPLTAPFMLLMAHCLADYVRIQKPAEAA